MSFVRAFLAWLFSRRLSAAERYRLWALEYSGWLLLEVEKGWLCWDAPAHRAWLLKRLRRVEQAAFWWAPRRCGALAQLMHRELTPATLIARIVEASRVLIGAQSAPIRRKRPFWRRRRTFLGRRKLKAFRARMRRPTQIPLHRAARGPPSPSSAGGTASFQARNLSYTRRRLNI